MCILVSFRISLTSKILRIKKNQELKDSKEKASTKDMKSKKATIDISRSVSNPQIKFRNTYYCASLPIINIIIFIAAVVYSRTILLLVVLNITTW